MQANRWWVYQRERFPLCKNGLLILAFSASALTYSRLLRGEYVFSDIKAYSVAFITALMYFMQLRIADEFKDFDEDTKYRPYRPVPRGLVTLKELGWVFVIGSFLQVILALWLHPPLIILLLITWLYLAGMSKEFFVREWIKAHPITYLWTHMLIMPLVDLYITSCDWLVKGYTQPPEGIVWFLTVSFFNGILLEFGRKIRAKEDEEEGVETFTVLWGISKASFAWLLALTLNFIAMLMAAKQSETLLFCFALLMLPYFFGIWVITRFYKQPQSKHAKSIETFSGLWTLAMYVTLGPLAMGFNMLTR